MLQTASRPINTGARGYIFNSRCAAAFVMATVLPVAGCANVNAQLNPAKRHHTPDGFKNNYTSGGAKSPADLFRWQHQRLRDGLPKAPQTPTPVAAPLLEFDQSKAVAATMRPAITWAAHATMLVQANGLHVSADPIFSERASPVHSFGPKRAQPRGLSMEQLPNIDAVPI